MRLRPLERPEVANTSAALERPEAARPEPTKPEVNNVCVLRPVGVAELVLLELPLEMLPAVDRPQRPRRLLRPVEEADLMLLGAVGEIAVRPVLAVEVFSLGVALCLSRQ